MNVLEVNDLCVSYRTKAGDLPAVRHVSLHVQEGECVGLVGESGCGKSTIALAIMQYLGSAGVIRQGTIQFQGRDLRRLRPQELRRVRGAQIAMVYQEPAAALNPSLTIGTQLLEVPRTHARLRPSAALAAVRHMLDAVHLADIERTLASYPHQLSGGQLQRVLIAMALLARPALLLLDEPTTALDVTIEAGIISLIHELRQQFATSMLFISHNLGLIRTVCERVYVMYAGEIVEEGSVTQVFDSMRHPYTRGLLAAMPRLDLPRTSQPLRAIPGQPPAAPGRPAGCAFAPRCAYVRPAVCEVQPLAINGPSGIHRVRCQRWQEIVWQAEPPEAVPAPPAAAIGAPILQVESLRKYYALSGQWLAALWRRTARRSARANESISFSIRVGEAVALVGESGSGKSTVARILLGLETATAGRVLWAGVDIARRPVSRRTHWQRRMLQMVFQHPHDTLNPSLSIGRQLARVLKKNAGVMHRDARQAHIQQLLAQVHLPPSVAGCRPAQLSGGQLQRVSIVRAFAALPALVVADEPVSALDVSVQAAVLHLLLARQREQRTALLLISHDLGVVRYVADRVVVLYLGHIMEQGSTDEVFAPPYHPYTEALLAAVPTVIPVPRTTSRALEGPLPSVIAPPSGCPFVTRCPRKVGPICETTRPPLQENAPGHVIACHIPLATLRQGTPVFRQ